MIDYEDFLARLNGVRGQSVRRNGPDQASAFCPAHPDLKDRSLSVTRKDGGGVLAHCFVGCTWDEILSALDIGHARGDGSTRNGGVPARPLTLEDFAAAKGLPVEFLVANHVRQEARGLQITYLERDGRPARQQRTRTALVAKDGSEWIKGAGSPIPYGRWRLDEAMERGELYLVEGESNSLTAWLHNVPALGIPGADMTKVLTAEDLKGIARINIMRDPDRGGAIFVAGGARRLQELGWPGHAHVVSLPVKDLNELHLTAGERFADELLKAKSAATPLSVPSARLETLTWAEMVAEPPRAIDYHWPGWVPLATVALLAGAGDSLKSWLLLLLATFTAAGRAPLVAEETDEVRLRSGPVLYITAENGIEEEKRRCGLLREGLALPADLPITFVRAETLTLGQEEDFAEILALVERVRPVAIFIDSAIAVSGLEDENRNSLVRVFMKTRVLPLARVHGATVYVVMHSPKPSMQPGQRFTDEHVARGAGDWRNAADVVLYLRRDRTLGPSAVVLRHAKVRVGRRHASIWFALEDVVPDRSVRIVYGGAFAEDTGQAAAAGLARAIDAAVEVLKGALEGLTPSVLEKGITGPGVSRATARRAVEVVRGKRPWPHGPLAGRKGTVVLEERRGRTVNLALDVAQAEQIRPEREDGDDD